MASLFKEVRSEQNIFEAWRHVKRSALNSANEEIRGMAAEFEHAHQKHLRRLIDQLRTGKFVFDPVKGVLKDKSKRLAQGKDPRPIAIATLKNRVVQRAILQVLQPRVALNMKDIDTRYQSRRDPRLGRINDVNQSKFGVGGLMKPYGGVPAAIRVIREAIDSGAKYFYQSDIKSFFTDIPTKNVIDFVRAETHDEQLVMLFQEGLAVHLSNEIELQSYASLFPKGGIGVAQGSSLSAFAGNVLLYDLDHKLNKEGVTTVRYIDDILMVAKDENFLNTAIALAETELKSFGFGLYKPAAGSDKAARGECVNAINFLGCTIQPNRCVPSMNSIKKMKDSTVGAISESKAQIKDATSTNKELPAKFSQSGTLDRLGKKIYGWQKSFAFCTDEQPFRLLDEYISKQVVDYVGFISRVLSKRDQRTQAMILGIPSTQKMFITQVGKQK
jgi:RNA-directed DNA polymerase